jgi:hypothetical protein
MNKFFTTTAARAALTVLVIFLGGTTNYAHAKSGLVGAAGTAAAKQVGKATAKQTSCTTVHQSPTLDGKQYVIISTGCGPKE